MSNSLPVEQFVPEQAIQSYLDALLQDAAAELALGEVDKLAAPVQRAPAPQAVADPPKPEPAPQAAQPPAPIPPVVQPSWREQPFEALLFDVGGLTLAVPLISLGTIYPLDGPITPLFGQPDWFLGLLPGPTNSLKVLDTARWIMPERYQPSLREGLRFVISMQGHEWGMAVHGVSESIRLDPAQVKWRSGQGKRPWLAGTVIEHMCALLDVEALAELVSKEH